MNYILPTGTATYATTSGTGVVLGISGQPCTLLGIMPGAGTPLVTVYSGAAATAVIAKCTMSGGKFMPFPYAAPAGISYNFSGGPLTFYWVPGPTT